MKTNQDFRRFKVPDLLFLEAAKTKGYFYPARARLKGAAGQWVWEGHGFFSRALLIGKDDGL